MSNDARGFPCSRSRLRRELAGKQMLAVCTGSKNGCEYDLIIVLMSLVRAYITSACHVKRFSGVLQRLVKELLSCGPLF